MTARLPDAISARRRAAPKCGGMNAPALNLSDEIRRFVPWVDDDELALRTRLRKARDLGAVRAVAATGHARSRTLYWMVADVAGEWMLSPASNDDLKDVADAMVRLFMVAGALERLEAPDAG